MNLVWCRPHGPEYPGDVWHTGWTDDDVAAWDKQIRHRWPDRLVLAVFCHGDEDAWPWQLDPDPPRKFIPTRKALAELRAAFPDRLIVLIACNPRGDMLQAPDVAYSPWDVWIHPGPDRQRLAGTHQFVTCAGSINEFVTTPPTPETK